MQFKKEVVDWTQKESILNFRKRVEEGAGKFGKVPKDIKVSPANIEGKSFCRNLFIY
jgi:hypothetical protein